MEQKGIKTLIIDAEERPLNIETIKSVQAFKPNLTCSFNRINSLPDGKFLWDYLQIPHLSILHEPVFYSTDLTSSNFSIIGCSDSDDIQTLQSNGFNRTLFFPDAIEEDLFLHPKEEKSYDIVMVGSCYDYENLRTAWRAKQPVPVNKMLDDAIDRVLSSDSTPLSQAFVEAWSASNCNPEGVDFPVLFSYLDYYVRGRDRVELIRSIKTGHIHIFGDLAEDNPVGIFGWKKYLHNQKNVTIHPSVSYADSISILRKAKIVLNSFPFFRNGSHERVLAAFANDALPFSSESKFLRGEFGSNTIEFYSSKDYSHCSDKMATLLSSDLSERIELGRSITRKAHLWSLRVDLLLG